MSIINQILDAFAYKGHVVKLIPEQDKDHWVARVIVEVHSGGTIEKIHYRDHTQTYPSLEAARAASSEFGKQMIENFTIPAYGEGEYRSQSDVNGPGHR